MADYDIGQAFAQIQEELIDSIMRNMSRHRAEELKEGYDWAMWQAQQLKSFEGFKKDNAKKYKNKFKGINKKIDEIIRQAKAEGGLEQEQDILEAIKNGFTGYKRFKGTARTTGEFFKLNEHKLNALIKATTNDMQKAETAILRMANDQYRKAIYNAQVYANSGAGTYEKAVDMACSNMLNAGLNCVEYKNGARHTLEDYADMALKTANKRAYLQGEGEKRQEWCINTVIVNKRGNPCPLCLPFCGRVFIDDVWSGGKASDGDYPLLSTAIRAGLYHPRCKDSHTTYFEGVSTPPELPSKEEKQQTIQDYNQQQKMQYAQNQAKKCLRIAKYSLDEDNKRIYYARAKQWENKANIYNKSVVKSADNSIYFMSNSAERTYVSIGNVGKIKVSKVKDSNFNMFTDVYSDKKAIELTEKNLNNIQSNLPKDFELPDIVVADFEKNKISSTAIAGYDKTTNTLWMNSKYDTSEKIIEYVTKNKGEFANTTQQAPYLHELGHKYYEDCIKALVKSHNIEYSKAMNMIDSKIMDYIHTNVSSLNINLSDLISIYANKGYKSHKYTELIAECFSVRNTNATVIDILKLLKG